MAFIFTNLPADVRGRRSALESYLNGLGTADQEQMATDAGITFTPASDIDVATQEDYSFLAIAADAATSFDYTAVDATIRDKYQEESIDDLLPERKSTLAQNTTIADKTGPVFTVPDEVTYLSLMIAKYPGWAKLIYENAIPGGDREALLEDFILQLSGAAKADFAAAIPTASYATDVLTGLFSIADADEYAGIVAQAYSMIKKKK